MDKKTYKLMNWPRIESIVYSEEDHPGELLGVHQVSGGILIQAFWPESKAVYLLETDKNLEHRMEQVDEQGYYVLFLPQKTIKHYKFSVVWKKNPDQKKRAAEKECMDPYQFKTTIKEKDLTLFHEGIHYEIYKVLGSHVKTIDGVKGTEFAVWAPNALRVSVVGPFNNWDGRVYPMNRLEDSQVFALFIPEITEGTLYKYEIKAKNSDVFLKADPYSFCQQLRPADASIVQEEHEFDWTDLDYLLSRRKKNTQQEPMNVYEVHLGSYALKEDGSFYHYEELGKMLLDYVKEMKYTHIELMPIMEHPLDESWGYQVIGYYAPTSRFGTGEELKRMIDSFHEAGIGVILDWVPAHFPKDMNGLYYFDGTPLYHYSDPRKGLHPDWGTCVFDYGRKEVSNYLIANALYWVEEFHADGIRMDAVASMLYLDYGRRDGEWVANIYGGNENLEAVELIKHLNSVLHKRDKGVLSIAEESTAWPKVTGKLTEDGLGFDYKWNMGWMNDFIDYIQYDPYFRSHHHGELTFSMIYHYSENFMLPFSHDEVVYGKKSMLMKMPGELDAKFAGLRAAFGYLMTHPGKKLSFMGNEYAKQNEWYEKESLLQSEHLTDDNLKLQHYVKKLNELYQQYPALYQYDHVTEGFEWINNISANENVIVFLRKSDAREDTLLVVLNFSNVEYDNYKIGVPFEGKYKEIFYSDDAAFGGQDRGNKRVKVSRAEECDARPNSIRVTLAPLGMHIFSCTPCVNTPKKTAAATKKAVKKPAVKRNLKAELEEKFEIAEEQILSGSEVRKKQ